MLKQNHIKTLAAFSEGQNLINYKTKDSKEIIIWLFGSHENQI